MKERRIGKSVPETELCNEHSTVPFNAEVHDPVVEISSKNFTDDHRDLYSRN